VHPAMQPADAFLKDLEIMVRTLVAGAVSPSQKPRPVKPAIAKKSIRATLEIANEHDDDQRPHRAPPR